MKPRRPETEPRVSRPTDIPMFSRVAVSVWLDDGETSQHVGEDWTGILVPKPSTGTDDSDYVRIMPDEPRGDEGYGFASRYPRSYPLTEQVVLGDGRPAVGRLVLEVLAGPPDDLLGKV